MFSDQPINCQADDVYDRASFAQMLAEVLISNKLGESLCVGLMGPWGSGKTSVINMAIEHILSEDRNPKISIMRFEPWNFTTPEQLTGQFFLQLAELFSVEKEDKKRLGTAIIEYAQVIETTSLFPVSSPARGLISGFVKAVLAITGKAISKQAFESKSAQAQKDELQKLLEGVKEKIIIVIDDIDRLTDMQIGCVFQLVTVVCKFPNINYLLSFDRNIVVKALDNIQDGRGNSFLDKVIQVPITLPRMHKAKLYSYMTECFNKLIADREIPVDKRKWRELYEFCVSRLITTHRDIIRLINGIQTKMLQISEEICFEDLVALTIIEQHEPDLYEWIKLHQGRLTGQITFEDIHDHDNSDQAKEKRNKQYREELEEVLQDQSVFSVGMAVETLCILFPALISRIGGYHSGYYDNESLRKGNCVGHPLKFDRYFSYLVDKGQITAAELKYILRSANEEEIEQLILEKDKDAASIELFSEIRVRSENISKGRIELLIRALDKVNGRLHTNATNGIFPLYAPNEAKLLINHLFLRLDIDERENVLDRLIADLEETDLDTVSYIMSMFSNGHNGVDKQQSSDDRYPKLSTLDVFHKYEKAFLEKVKEIAVTIDTITIIRMKNFINYYKQFPAGKKFLSSAFSSNPSSLLCFVSSTMSHLRPVGTDETTEIDFKEEYLEFVSKEQVKEAIQKVINSGELKTMEKDVQRSVVAIIMREENPLEFSGTIQTGEIDERLRRMFD